MTALREAAGNAMPQRLPALETRRLVLRAPRAADADAIAAGLADYEVARMLLRVPRPYFRQDALDWIGGRPNGIGEAGFAFAVTCEGNAIGVVHFDLRARGVELGYWLDRRCWRRGLMSEAVSAAVGWYFAAVRGGCIRSRVLSDNAAALRLQRKLGFAVTGLSETFALARNCSQPLVESQLDADGFIPVAGSAPAAYRHVV